MKKTIATIVAVILVACLTVPAFAATQEVETANIPSAQIGEGKTVASADSGTTVSENTNATAKEALPDAVAAENKAESIDGKVLYVFDVTSGSNTAKVKFAMPSDKKFAYALHFNNATGKWEKIDASYADGTLTATSANGWSPVAVIVTSTSSTTPVSPQTGETTPAVYVVCAMVLAAAAAAFFFKSRKTA